jgi:nucleotide-binding universal stress UspA family protein
MFNNVLVGVDGGPNGRDAIALASQLTDTGGKLTLAYVQASVVAEDREDCRKLLEEERTAANVEAELVSVASTDPGRGLHEQAEEQSADLLVVGSCSHAAFARVMMGDDTRAALNGASCAVAIAARGHAEQRKPIESVGIGYNGSAESMTALAIARELAAPTGASVKALDVVSLTVYAYSGFVPAAIGENVDELIQHANSGLEELAGVEGRAVYGLAGEELATFSDEVDILVVGSRGYGPVRRLVLGSTSNYLERHARCSLVVVPRGAAGSESVSAQDAKDTAPAAFSP